MRTQATIPIRLLLSVGSSTPEPIIWGMDKSMDSTSGRLMVLLEDSSLEDSSEDDSSELVTLELTVEVDEFFGLEVFLELAAGPVGPAGF